jgi:hypothetical protein
MSRFIVFVGDIHGQVHKMQSLWENISRVLKSVSQTAPTFPTSVVFLGDYCDRGNFTRETFDFLVDLPCQHKNISFKFLCGNHDQALAKFIENDIDYSATWKQFVPRKQEILYTGNGSDTMHLQGRRWAGQFSGLDNDSIYQARSTCESYNSPYPDRDALISAIPSTHKEFLASMEYVYEYENEDYGRIIAVHGGLENGRLKEVDSQLQDLRDRNDHHQFNEPLCGRQNVLHMPSIWSNTRTWVVSGHHGIFSVSGRRLVVDESGGKDENRMSAVLFMPSAATAQAPTASSRGVNEEEREVRGVESFVDGDQFSWCESVDPLVRLLRIRSAI